MKSIIFKVNIFVKGEYFESRYVDSVEEIYNIIWNEFKHPEDIIIEKVN